MWIIQNILIKGHFRVIIKVCQRNTQTITICILNLKFSNWVLNFVTLVTWILIFKSEVTCVMFLVLKSHP